jgi:alpha-2-macroglobulin
MADWRYWWSSVDVRDDRITFFAQTLPRGVHVIEYNLRARTPGVYRALPTFLQGMYTPETRSESGESQVDVR